MRPLRVRFFFGPGSGVLSKLRFFLYSANPILNLTSAILCVLCGFAVYFFYSFLPQSRKERRESQEEPQTQDSVEQSGKGNAPASSRLHGLFVKREKFCLDWIEAQR